MNETMDLLIDNTLFTLVIIFLSGIIGSKASEKLKVPDVVIYLIIGVIIGPSLLNLIDINESSLVNQMVLIYGAAFIIYCGGREIKLKVLNQIKISVALMSTLGVIISTAIVALATHLIFHFDIMVCLLIGAIIASTDPASLIPIFKKVTLKENLKNTVIAESAFNDAVGTVLIVTLVSFVAGGSLTFGEAGINLITMIVLGVVIGGTIGYIFSYLIGHHRQWFTDYSAIISLIVSLAAYSIADKFGGSGFMSTFIAGLICGNKASFGLFIPRESAKESAHFRAVLEELFKISIFILLGSHLDIANVTKYFFPSLAVVLVLVLIARPISVFICTIYDPINRWTVKEKLFMCWVRETGVIPAAMSSFIVSMGLVHSDVISSIVFMAIIVTIGLQSSLTTQVVKLLKL